MASPNPDGPSHGPSNRARRGKGTPLVFEYRCALCGLLWPITAGDPKAGFCPVCSSVVSPETRAAIGRRCSENPPP